MKIHGPNARATGMADSVHIKVSRNINLEFLCEMEIYNHVYAIPDTSTGMKIRAGNWWHCGYPVQVHEPMQPYHDASPI